MKKRIVALVMAIIFLICLACDDTRLVVDENGIGTEKNVTIYEASQNTP